MLDWNHDESPGDGTGRTFDKKASKRVAHQRLVQGTSVGRVRTYATTVATLPRRATDR
jgi:hypothetical protein